MGKKKITIEDMQAIAEGRGNAYPQNISMQKRN